MSTSPQRLPSENSDTHLNEIKATKSSRPGWLVPAAAVAGVVVVLGLALGLGLGLGLKHHHHDSSAESAGSGGTSGNGSVADQAVTVSTMDSSLYFMNTSVADESPTTRYYEWSVEERVGAPDGTHKSMLVVNGQFPGPTIEANEGDRIIVNVTNNMINATAIHWHGLYQNGTNYYDGTAGITQCGIPPGEWMVYNYTLEGWRGTTWWHAHSGVQYTDGITGALVVHSKNESVPEYDGDVVFMLSDLYHDTAEGLLVTYFQPNGIQGTPANEPVPDGGTINGIGQYADFNSTFFNITLEQNKTYRLRIINAGSLVGEQFSVDNHLLTVIEADGTAVEPVVVSSVFPVIAQRYSVLLTTNQSAGAYWVRMNLDASAFTYSLPYSVTQVFGVIRYGVPDDTLPDMSLQNSPPSYGANDPGDLDEGDLIPVGGGPAPEPTFNTSIQISMQYPLYVDPGTDYLGQYLAFINSTSWSPLTGTSTLFSHLGENATDGGAVFTGEQQLTTVDKIETVQLLVQNLDDGDHYFHLHGFKFWWMGSGAGVYSGQAVDNTHPRIRDTTIIPAYTWTLIRFVADNPGYWAFHCHIQWHMAAGMLTTFNILPSKSAQFEYPQYMVDQCASS